MFETKRLFIIITTQKEPHWHELVFMFIHNSLRPSSLEPQCADGGGSILFLVTVYGQHRYLFQVWTVPLIQSAYVILIPHCCLPLLSTPSSARLQGHQLVHHVKKVQERRQVSEYPLHLCQAGSWRCLFHHVYRLCTLLVALRMKKKKKEDEEMKISKSTDDEKSCRRPPETGSLLLLRLFQINHRKLTSTDM